MSRQADPDNIARQTQSAEQNSEKQLVDLEQLVHAFEPSKAYLELCEAIKVCCDEMAKRLGREQLEAQHYRGTTPEFASYIYEQSINATQKDLYTPEPENNLARDTNFNTAPSVDISDVGCFSFCTRGEKYYKKHRDGDDFNLAYEERLPDGREIKLALSADGVSAASASDLGAKLHCLIAAREARNLLLDDTESISSPVFQARLQAETLIALNDIRCSFYQTTGEFLESFASTLQIGILTNKEFAHLAYVADGVGINNDRLYDNSILSGRDAYEREILLYNSKNQSYTAPLKSRPPLPLCALEQYSFGFSQEGFSPILFLPETQAVSDFLVAPKAFMKEQPDSPLASWANERSEQLRKRYSDLSEDRLLAELSKELIGNLVRHESLRFVVLASASAANLVGERGKLIALGSDGLDYLAPDLGNSKIAEDQHGRVRLTVGALLNLSDSEVKELVDLWHAVRTGEAPEKKIESQLSVDELSQFLEELRTYEGVSEEIIDYLQKSLRNDAEKTLSHFSSGSIEHIDVPEALEEDWYELLDQPIDNWPWQKAHKADTGSSKANVQEEALRSLKEKFGIDLSRYSPQDLAIIYDDINLIGFKF